jgi:hypothetical protein
MKSKIPTLLALALLTSSAAAHERITLGPNGGRVIYVDSVATPNVEFLVNKDGRAEIALLDKARKPMTLSTQNVVVSGGPRASAKKLTVEKKGAAFLTEKMPEGAPYVVVIQLKEQASSKATTLRINYDPTPAKSGKPTYLDDSMNGESGPSIAIPDTLEGLFAEINQHFGELQENYKEKKYEALDEVTQAFTKLLQALPGKAGEKKAQAEPEVALLVAHLAEVADANASRELSKGKQAYDSIVAGIPTLKKHFPEKVANAKL